VRLEDTYGISAENHCSKVNGKSMDFACSAEKVGEKDTYGTSAEAHCDGGAARSKHLVHGHQIWKARPC